MLRSLGTHLVNQWMGALSLFLVLGGGVAYAAGTIGSADIIDDSILSIDVRNDQIRSADIRNDTQTAGGLAAVDLASGSVGVSELDPLAFAAPDISQDSPTAPFEIANNAVQGVEVLDETLTGSDVASNSLTGADINETTLTGLDGHDAYRDHCDTPNDNSFRDCVSVTFSLGRAMEVLVMYGGGGFAGDGSSAERVYGECRTKVDGVNRLEPVNLVNESTTPVGMASIFDVIALSAGTHTVAFACREDTTNMEFADLTIGVLELSVD